MSAMFASPAAAPAVHPAGIGGLTEVTLALLAVLALVCALAWLLRRVRGFGNRVGGAIDVLADVPLGQKERAVLLRVGRTQILLGVAPGRVNALHVLAEPLELTVPSASLVPSFRAQLLRSLGR